MFWGSWPCFLGGNHSQKLPNCIKLLETRVLPPNSAGLGACAETSRLDFGVAEAALKSYLKGVSTLLQVKLLL